MNTLLVTTLMLIAYTTALPTVYEADDPELLSREERAWSEDKTDELKCDPGHYAKEITLSGGIRGFQCQKCPEGTYARTAGTWSACVPCDDGEVTDGIGATKCYAGCVIGYGWNSEVKRCQPCPKGTHKDFTGLEPCSMCRPFHNSVKASAMCFVKCPKGFEPGILANGSSTCKPCPFGSYQKVAGKLGDNQPCVSCCDGLTESECTRNWTLTTGTERKSCFKTTGDTTMKYAVLVDTLKKAEPHIRDDDDSSDRLLRALCRSGADLTDLRTKFMECMEMKVKVSGEEEIPIPRLRLNEHNFEDLGNIFLSGQIRTCDSIKDSSSDDESESSGWNSSSYWTSSSSYMSSGSYSWSSSSSYMSGGSSGWGSGSSGWGSGSSGWGGSTGWGIGSSGWGGSSVWGGSSGWSIGSSGWGSGSSGWGGSTGWGIGSSSWGSGLESSSGWGSSSSYMSSGSSGWGSASSSWGSGLESSSGWESSSSYMSSGSSGWSSSSYMSSGSSGWSSSSYMSSGSSGWDSSSYMSSGSSGLGSSSYMSSGFSGLGSSSYMGGGSSGWSSSSYMGGGSPGWGSESSYMNGGSSGWGSGSSYMGNSNSGWGG